MTYENHDVELTAYALGELSPDEAAAVAARLRADPAAAAEVDRVRATARRLEAALSAEADPPAVAGKLGPPRWLLLAAAACVVGGLTAGVLLMDGRSEPPRVAVGEAVPPSVPLPEPAPGKAAASEPQPVEEVFSEFAVQRRVELDLIRYRFNEAKQEASEALSRGDIEAARVAVQRARTARDANSAVFNDKQIAGFDREVEQMEKALQPVIGITREERRVLDADDADQAEVAELRDSLQDVTQASQQRLGPRAATDSFLLPTKDVPAPAPADAWRHAPPDDHEDYDHTRDNDFASPTDAPLSTFSVDVDTASYANVRRFLTDNRLPPADAVRVEELVNYFDYDYPTPALDDSVPFAANVAVAGAPWAKGHKLVRIGLQAADVDAEDRPGANLVFLVDVSGSMQSPDKLPLVQRGLRTMLGRLDGRDTVSMVVYAGDSGVALPPTPGDDHATIGRAIDGLTAGGSTNGAAGIRDAYDLARENFRDGGVNRVVLATDGDFNVGTTDQGSLVRLVEEQAKSGVYLTVLGFGTGNLNDAMMEQVSNKGDGFYAYVDSEREAERVLGERMLSTVQAVAKDVKVQVEFNPAAVSSYRLIGYANRVMPDRDFDDDTKDAGDVGAGHQVTALYEVVPAGVPDPSRSSGLAEGELKYQRPTTRREGVDSSELATVKLRWKAPDAAKERGTSRKVEFAVKDADVPFAEADGDLRFAAAVAGFGMLLRESEARGDLTWPILLDLIEPMRRDGDDRREFGDLAERAAALSR